MVSLLKGVGISYVESRQTCGPLRFSGKSCRFHRHVGGTCRSGTACRSDPHIERRRRLKADVGAFEPREHLRNVAAGYGLERTPGLQKAVGPVGYPRPDALALYAQLVQVETSGIASGRETPGEPQQRVVVMCYGLEYVQVGTCVTIVGKSRKCLRTQRTPQNLRCSLGGSTRRTVGPSPRSVDTGPFETLRHPDAPALLATALRKQ